MSISELFQETSPEHRVLEQRATTASTRPISFPELFVVLNGCIPLVMLAYDARQHQLGPDPIRNALHTTGMVALVLLIATLTITPLRKLVNVAELFYFRRPLGLLAFLYGCSHLGIYVVYDRACNWQDVWNELSERRYLQVGTVALLLMVPLALTSTPRTVRLLGFAKWKILHRLIYGSVVAAVVHYYMETKADTRLPIAMSAAVAALLLIRLLTFGFKWRKNRDSRAIRGAAVSASIVHEVFFSISNQTLSVDATTTVLEAAESIGLTLSFDCRAGICGQCKTRLIAGLVSMDSDEALSETEKMDGLILACQACPRGNIVIEA